MGAVSTFWKAKISNLMPNFGRDPAIATKRFARNNLDDAFGLSTITTMRTIYEGYTNQSFSQGNKEKYVQDTEKFLFYIRGQLICIENAEGGAINLIRNRIQEISNKAHKIESNLARMKKNIPQKEYQEVLDNMHKRWLEINHVIVEDVLSNTIKLQKNVEYGRSQMITQSFRFDLSMKKDIGFFFSRDRESRKQEKSLFKAIDIEISKLSSLQNLSLINKKMEELSESIQKEMQLIQEELRFLTILMIHITENVDSLEKVILQSLTSSGLDEASILKVKTSFNSLRDYVKQESAKNVERAKQLIPEAAAIH